MPLEFVLICACMLCLAGCNPQCTHLMCRVEQMGPEIVYVSGRTRAVGEMNGKSANLNNCASQIYPDDLGIPPNELICIFDADQASPHLTPVL